MSGPATTGDNQQNARILIVEDEAMLAYILKELLEEAGYVRDGDSWRAPEFVSLDRLTASVN